MVELHTLKFFLNASCCWSRSRLARVQSKCAKALRPLIRMWIGSTSSNQLILIGRPGIHQVGVRASPAYHRLGKQHSCKAPIKGRGTLRFSPSKAKPSQSRRSPTFSSQTQGPSPRTLSAVRGSAHASEAIMGNVAGKKILTVAISLLAVLALLQPCAAARPVPCNTPRLGVLNKIWRFKLGQKYQAHV